VLSADNIELLAADSMLSASNISLSADNILFATDNNILSADNILFLAENTQLITMSYYILIICYVTIFLFVGNFTHAKFFVHVTKKISLKML
jgi:hypothetical protein